MLITLVVVVSGVLIIAKLLQWWNGYNKLKEESEALFWAEMWTKQELIKFHVDAKNQIRDAESIKNNLQRIKILERAIAIQEKVSSKNV